MFGRSAAIKAIRVRISRGHFFFLMDDNAIFHLLKRLSILPFQKDMMFRISNGPEVPFPFFLQFLSFLIQFLFAICFYSFHSHSPLSHPISWLLLFLALPILHILFLTFLTFNNQFISFLDKNSHTNEYVLPVTHTWTKLCGNTKYSTHTHRYYSHFRQQIKDTLDLSVSPSHCPSPSVYFLMSLKTQVFIHYSWWFL